MQITGPRHGRQPAAAVRSAAADRDTENTSRAPVIGEEPQEWQKCNRQYLAVTVPLSKYRRGVNTGG